MHPFWLPTICSLWDLHRWLLLLLQMARFTAVVDHCNYEALKTPIGKRRAEHVQIIPNDKHNLCVLLMAILSGATSI